MYIYWKTQRDVCIEDKHQLVSTAYVLEPNQSIGQSRLTKEIPKGLGR